MVKTIFSGKSQIKKKGLWILPNSLIQDINDIEDMKKRRKQFMKVEKAVGTITGSVDEKFRLFLKETDDPQLLLKKLEDEFNTTDYLKIMDLKRDLYVSSKMSNEDDIQIKA